MERSPGGRSSEAVIDHALFVFRAREALRLQVEHRAVAAAVLHQLVVTPEFDDTTVLEHADAVGVADGGEAVRNKDRRRMAGGGEDAIEDLSFPPHVEL